MLSIGGSVGKDARPRIVSFRKSTNGSTVKPLDQPKVFAAALQSRAMMNVPSRAQIAASLAASALIAPKSPVNLKIVYPTAKTLGARTQSAPR